MHNYDDIKNLLNKSHQLEVELISPSIDLDLYNDSQRLLAVASLAMLSVEHSAGLRYLFKTKCHASSFALFRLQYEALVKSFWVFYVSKDEDIDSIVGELEEARVIKNKKAFPSLSKMLEELLSAQTPAHNIVLALMELKNYSWDAMNSFVHSGLHAVRRNITGYPTELIYTIIKQSNNLLYMSAYLRAILTGNPNAIKEVSLARQKHMACF
ncbi:DUF6988 family protein [Acinetobacter beijerinckii]|uniref:Uncharacterized protein n=1 Tax=Acinetobacter beijerinckii ANC 3835 TaxID=1217649 RepID=N9FDA4_9GAMM|nr:hypothetical protein [Acinetobacter beijerinckii]ENW05275.1 hypothetical protein F934_01239 [Acinetobacter beijerinckii ANC 3835]